MQYKHMNLGRIRKLKGLSLADLAAKIGKDPSTVQRAETMHKSAKLETYFHCAEALGVTISDIFCEEFTPIERELVMVFRQIPPERHAALAEVLRMAANHVPPST